MRSPFSVTVPSSARWLPSITLNAVVFPEPLGPIRAVTEPRGTANEHPSNAMTPP